MNSDATEGCTAINHSSDLAPLERLDIIINIIVVIHLQESKMLLITLRYANSSNLCANMDVIFLSFLDFI